jgi:hypothetical protein
MSTVLNFIETLRIIDRRRSDSSTSVLLAVQTSGRVFSVAVTGARICLG